MDYGRGSIEIRCERRRRSSHFHIDGVRNIPRVVHADAGQIGPSLKLAKEFLAEWDQCVAYGRSEHRLLHSID